MICAIGSYFLFEGSSAAAKLLAYANATNLYNQNIGITCTSDVDVWFNLSAVLMDSRVSQLKKDFHAQISAMAQKNNTNSSIALLTEEELSELENAWIQLIVWKQNDENVS